MEAYYTIADTIGGVPNLRGKDNVFQIIFVASSIAIGIGIGRLTFGALTGGVIGLFGGTLLSGLVLMIKGWLRAANKRVK
jgi:hypothetical protein